ncbi:MAG: lipid-A-disaccharide synthase [Deferribacteraceae bacterium]|jgi:lipid-A-disaccharide synthase|nr:lipid-A-disaccharide synthase [Deferribacteraceae bacterium]
MLKKRVLKLLIVAGEPSGDVHAANLAEEFLKTQPVELYGTGGQRLLALGQNQICDVSDMAVIGFDAVIRKIPFLLSLAKKIEKQIVTARPDAIILVDYAGFNLRLAKRLRKYNIPIIDLVAPQVWIWRYSRVKILAKYFDKTLCILPFEEDILRKEGVNAVYIGNPVTEKLAPKYKNREEFCRAYGINAAQPVIGLVPGSRPKEIEMLMPVMTAAAKDWKNDAQYILAKADSVKSEALEPYLKMKSDIKVAEGETADVMRYSDLLWICSGTATLEAAIIGTPMIILYNASRFNVILIKMFTSLRMIGMPNIITGREIAPELLENRCNAEELKKTSDILFENREEYKKRLIPIGEMFAGYAPMKTAAEEILNIL